MTEQLVVAPFAAALGTAVLSVALKNHPKLQEAVTAGGLATYACLTVALAASVVGGEPLTYQMSGWPAPYGITMVADSLSGLMVLLTAAVALPSFLYSVAAERFEGTHLPLFTLMITGATGAFLTGDLFNLFVWFEVTLMSSYVLLAYGGGGHETRTALQYLAVNLVGSSFMLVAIGGIYSTMGTVNMADLSVRLANPQNYRAAPAASLGFFGLLFSVFALKAGLAPFQFWVPEAYRAAPNSVSALLSGVAKKVGIYAIIRVYLGVLSSSAISVTAFNTVFAPVELFGYVMLAMGAVSIIIGGIGALSKDRLDYLLSYSSIGQVGMIFVPLGIAAVSGLQAGAIAAGVAYVLNHGVAKSMMFLASGTVKEAAGTDRFEDLSGLVESSRILAAAFFIGAVSLVGIPPTLGFFGKFGVFLAARSYPLVLAVALLGGVLTIIYMSRTWNSVFWGERSGSYSFEPGAVGATLVLASLLLALGLGFEAVNLASEAAAEAVLDQQAYTEAVLGDGS